MDIICLSFMLYFLTRKHEERDYMISEGAKSTRILDIYNMLLRGQVVHKKELAERYRVNVKSIQRDLDSIRDFLSEQCVKRGVRQSVEYDKASDGYHLVTQEVSYLSQGEMLAVSKILLESRAFSKEQMISLLSRIENLCIAGKERHDIEQLICNELFNYHSPAHAEPQVDVLWAAAEAVMEQKIVEISYRRMKNKEVVHRQIEPVGILFSEYYFYLMGFIRDEETRDNFEKKDDVYPTIYRIDRIQKITVTKEKFFVPYKDRFKEGEYKNHIQYMYGGELKSISFRYYGPSVEAVLDRLPTAEITDGEGADGCLVKADVLGDGVLMWLLSQGSKVDVLSPPHLREAWLSEIQKISQRTGKSADR